MSWINANQIKPEFRLGIEKSDKVLGWNLQKQTFFTVYFNHLDKKWYDDMNNELIVDYWKDITSPMEEEKEIITKLKKSLDALPEGKELILKEDEAFAFTVLETYVGMIWKGKNYYVDGQKNSFKKENSDLF